MSSFLSAVPVQDNILEMEMAGQGRNYSYMFNFEQEFEHSEVRVWMEDNWQLVCRWASGVYLLMIFGGQYLMAKREPFQLRTPLIVWNLLLSIFSIFGAARTLPEFIFTFSTHGIYHSLCVPSFIERDRVSGFWTWMFVVSKVPELGDTVFIVLRKQKLIFLHWYHHVTVLIYCWYSFSEYTAPARWFVVMNFIVHSLMYSYYFLKASRVKVPRYIAMVITSLQLLQMVVGCFVNYTAYTFKLKGMKCGVSETNLKMSLLMYSSYFVLFARFFYNTYVGSKAGKNEKSKTSSAGEMILKMEKKILQQTDEIAKASSDKAFTQEIENIKNCEYSHSQPQADNELKEEIGKSNEGHFGKNTNEDEAKEATENITNKQLETQGNNKETQQNDDLEVKSFDKETNEECLDDRKVNDNINATTTRQK